MKKKMSWKAQQAEEEKKDALLPLVLASDEKPIDVEMPAPNSKETLLMRTVTWLRDSHALFDYETRQIVKK